MSWKGVRISNLGDVDVGTRVVVTWKVRILI
jgi:hypothetical protein